MKVHGFSSRRRLSSFLPPLALSFVFTCLATWGVASTLVAAKRVTRPLKTYPAPEANQGVAVDAEHVYAITNKAIGKHDKASGKKVGEWIAPPDSGVVHLNGGVVVKGKLYCAHSNWPRKPLSNTIEIWDAKTLRHIDTIAFEETSGALNWIDHRQGKWWAGVSFYGEVKSVEKTYVTRLDDHWKIGPRWTFPEKVIERFAPYANSGASFGPDGLLYATGHDHGEVFALRVPQKPGNLELVDVLPMKIEGQGICWDRFDLGVLYGIHRPKKEVVAARLSHDQEYKALTTSIVWERHEENPVLPPRKGDFFDVGRCMNPWVVKVGDRYRLYYSGKDGQGRQRIGMATTSSTNPGRWKRTGPLFENGKPGSFDARWCVLPHVVKFGDQWRMYYTGNAGRGVGLSSFPGIGVAFSEDGLRWKRGDGIPVLASSGNHGDPDAVGIAGGSLIEVGQGEQREWWFYYTGCPTLGSPLRLNQQKTICLAVSRDGIHWKKRGAVMYRDPERKYEDIGVAGPVVHLRPGGGYRMWYSAIGTKWGYYSICYAESEDGIHWRRGERPGDNLQLAPQGNGWERQMVEYPSVIREGDRWRLFYCGNGYGTTGIGTALGTEVSR